MTTPAAFRAECLEILRQEIPEDLEWLPWNEIPALRWRHDNARVESIIPRGWLVAAARRGDPEPDGKLRRQAALFAPDDAAAVGQWLLRRWIEHDTATPELTDARIAELRSIAERAAALAQRGGRGGSDAEARFQQLLRQEGNREAPTAMPHQGILAIVAACADAKITLNIERYIETYRHDRPAQCRLLTRLQQLPPTPATPSDSTDSA